MVNKDPLWTWFPFENHYNLYFKEGADFRCSLKIEEFLTEKELVQYFELNQTCICHRLLFNYMKREQNLSTQKNFDSPPTTTLNERNTASIISQTALPLKSTGFAAKPTGDEKKMDSTSLSKKELATKSTGLALKPPERTPETSDVDEGKTKSAIINSTKDEDEVNKKHSVRVTANDVTNPISNDEKSGITNVDELQSDELTPTQLPVKNYTLPIPRRICITSGTKSPETQLTVQEENIVLREGRSDTASVINVTVTVPPNLHYQ